MKSILFLISCLCLAHSAECAESPPNIVFFYADDLGYNDLACYGSKVAQTPRLDRLAREGTRFTQFYVSHCVCSPTRATAITGHFPARHRIYGHIAHLETNRERNMPDWLDVNAPSLPRALQQAGYRTAMIGKWHLGGGSGSKTWTRESRLGKPPVPPSPTPVINSPHAPAVAKYGFDHVRTTYGNSPTWKNAEVWPEPHDIYPYADAGWNTWSSRAVADETIGFLMGHVKSNHNKQPFYINVWFKDPHVPLTPTDDMRRPFAHLEGRQQTHYAVVRYMDAQIGRVLDTLDELGLRDDTLVFFASDNGAGKYRGGSNTPLREWKHFLYEGGIRVPLIVRWPEHVPAGRVDEQSILNLADFVPTLSKATGATMEHAGYESDGEDITAALQGREFKRSKPQFWHYPRAAGDSPTLAVRDGKWKFLTDPDGKRRELYDLDQDIGESNNIAADQPEVVRSLRNKLAAWMRDVGLEEHGRSAR